MDENISTTAESSSSSMQDYYNLIKAEHEANNAWSAEQAQKAMDYQTEMSNTAHQREVADLKAAGLNPVLSAGGSGATTGSGLAAQRSDENVQALYGLTKQAIDGITQAVKSMASSAKYYSGSAGYSNVTGISNTGDNLLDAMIDGAAGVLYRFGGITKDAGVKLVSSFVNGLKALSDRFLDTDYAESSWKNNDDLVARLAGKKWNDFKSSGSSYAPIKVSNTNSSKNSYYKTGNGRTVHVTGVAKGLNSAKSAIKRMLS